MTREADVAFAVSAGAAYVGVIFAGGPRELTPARAAAVLTPAGAEVRRVGVFGADFRDRVREVTPVVRLDVIQLHGDPSAKDVGDARRLFGGTVWAVVRVADHSVPVGAASLFDVADAVLFDPRAADKLGGTGMLLKWTALGPGIERIRSGRRVVLAGGLTPVNVEEAIHAVRPDVVDVSSGVESAPGIKDHARMTAFVEAVRRSTE